MHKHYLREETLPMKVHKCDRLLAVGTMELECNSEPNPARVPSGIHLSAIQPHTVSPTTHTTHTTS
jgi:hypothetical protein